MGMTKCLNQFLNRCPDCTYDMDESHHPNNKDCPNYRGIRVKLYNVVEKTDPSEKDKENLRE